MSSSSAGRISQALSSKDKLSHYFKDIGDDEDYTRYVYRQGTPAEAHLNLLAKPETAYDFYTLALDVFHDRLSTLTITSDYFVTGPSKVFLEKDSEAEKCFIVNLLMDAARAEHQPALVVLAQLRHRSSYQHYSQSILGFFNKLGYSLLSSKGDRSHEVWARRKPDQTATELQKSLLKDLKSVGASGSYYFLSYPGKLQELIQQLDTIYNKLPLINEQVYKLIAEIEEKARAGLPQEIEERRQKIAALGKEIFLAEKNAKEMDNYIKGQLDLAHKNAPVKEEKPPQVKIAWPVEPTQMNTLTSKPAQLKDSRRQSFASAAISNLSTIFKPLTKPSLSTVVEKDETMVDAQENRLPDAIVNTA